MSPRLRSTTFMSVVVPGWMSFRMSMSGAVMSTTGTGT